MLSAHVVILRASALNTVCNDGYMRRQRLAVMCDSRTCVVTAGRNKKKERAALLKKTDAYCVEQAGMALADFRARYLAETQQPRQAPGLAQL